jgi:hypothetical protein
LLDVRNVRIADARQQHVRRRPDWCCGDGPLYLRLLAFFCIRELGLRHDELRCAVVTAWSWLLISAGICLSTSASSPPAASRRCSGFLDAALTLVQALFA